jgi:hypothetical protein
MTLDDIVKLDYLKLRRQDGISTPDVLKHYIHIRLIFCFAWKKSLTMKKMPAR